MTLLIYSIFNYQISWIFIIYGQYSWQMCASRFFSGLGGGATFTCLPQFIAEIASDQ